MTCHFNQIINKNKYQLIKILIFVYTQNFIRADEVFSMIQPFYLIRLSHTTAMWKYTSPPKCKKLNKKK